MDGEELDEVHTESSGGEEVEEEVQEEGVETAPQPPQQDPEPQSTAGEPPAEPAAVPLPATPAGQVSALVPRCSTSYAECALTEQKNTSLCLVGTIRQEHG